MRTLEGGKKVLEGFLRRGPQRDELPRVARWKKYNKDPLGFLVQAALLASYVVGPEACWSDRFHDWLSLLCKSE